MSMSSAALSGNPDHVVREVIEGFVAERGPKRGLHHAAELLGVTERWVRGFRFGEPARVRADVFLRAVEARRAVRAERRARLLRELAEIGDEPDAPVGVEARDLGVRLDG